MKTQQKFIFFILFYVISSTITIYSMEGYKEKVRWQIDNVNYNAIADKCFAIEEIAEFISATDSSSHSTKNDEYDTISNFSLDSAQMRQNFAETDFNDEKWKDKKYLNQAVEQQIYDPNDYDNPLQYQEYNNKLNNMFPVKIEDFETHYKRSLNFNKNDNDTNKARGSHIEAISSKQGKKNRNSQKNNRCLSQTCKTPTKRAGIQSILL